MKDARCSFENKWMEGWKKKLWIFVRLLDSLTDLVFFHATRFQVFVSDWIA